MRISIRIQARNAAWRGADAELNCWGVDRVECGGVASSQSAQSTVPFGTAVAGDRSMVGKLNYKA